LSIGMSQEDRQRRLGHAGLRFMAARALDVILPGAGIMMDMAEAASAAHVFARRARSLAPRPRLPAVPRAACRNSHARGGRNRW
jgi:hypothetical protein